MAALDWAIAKNPYLPRSLKATLNAMARFAEPDQEYANCYASQATYAKFSGRSVRSVNRDVADLVHFGLATERTDPIPGKWEYSRGGEKRHQLWFDKIAGFNATDRAEYQRRRRSGQSKPREKLRAVIAKLDAENRWLRDVIIDRFNLELENGVTYDGYDVGSQPEGTTPTSDGYDVRATTGTTQDPHVVPDAQSDVHDRPEDQTAAERGERPVHAVENSAAPRDRSASRLVRSGDPTLRHLAPQQNRSYRTPPDAGLERPKAAETDDAGATPLASSHADVLCEVGRKWLAKAGVWHSVQLHRHLKAFAIRLGLQPIESDPILQRVENTLYAQHRHFLETRQGGTPGRGAPRGAVRGGQRFYRGTPGRGPTP